MSRNEPDFPPQSVWPGSPLYDFTHQEDFFSSVIIFASKSFQGEITSWDHLAIIKLGISFLPSTCQRNPREKTTQVWTTCVFPSARLQVCTPRPGLDLTQNVPPSICDGLLTLWLWESKRTQLILGRSRHNLTLCLMTEYSICAMVSCQESLLCGASFSTEGVMILLQNSNSLTGIHRYGWMELKFHLILQLLPFMSESLADYRVKQQSTLDLFRNPWWTIFYSGLRGELAMFCTCISSSSKQ